MTEYLMNTYKRQPVAFLYGQGAWLWDAQGNKYLDALSGIAVTGLGHAHPKLTQALSRQMKQLMHTSNLYRITVQEDLAQRLCEISGMRSAFFCNSGAEANEAAIKLARLHAHRRGIHEPIIVVMEGSFHGRTLATLAATGSVKAQAGFGPLPSGFLRVPYGDVNLLRALRRKRNIVAVMLEPVQGESGVRIAPPGFLRAVRDLCSRKGWLMILDEVQSGMGRTGKWFAWQHEDVRPDIMTLAKSLGGGFPVGACLASGAAADVFAPGTHGSTFGGNPLACRAALTVIDTIARDKLVGRAETLGRKMLQGFRTGLSGVAGIADIRGQGLMIGIELDRPCPELVAQALERKLLINVTADRVIRLLPPLIIKEREATLIVDEVCALVRTFLATPQEVVGAQA